MVVKTSSFRQVSSSFLVCDRSRPPASGGELLVVDAPLETNRNPRVKEIAVHLLPCALSVASLGSSRDPDQSQVSNTTCCMLEKRVSWCRIACALVYPVDNEQI